MTFEQWWSEVEKRAGAIGTERYRPEMRRLAEIARQAYCAALTAICEAKFTREEFPTPCGLPQEIKDQILALGKWES